MKRLIVGGVAALTVALATAAPASAMHTRGYLDTLDAAGLIDHDGDHGQIIDGLCHGQFDEDGADAIFTGEF